MKYALFLLLSLSQVAFAAEKNDELTVQCDMTEYKRGSKELNYIFVAERQASTGKSFNIKDSRNLEYSPGVTIGIRAYTDDGKPSDFIIVGILNDPKNYRVVTYLSDGGSVDVGNVDSGGVVVKCKWINGAEK